MKALSPEDERKLYMYDLREIENILEAVLLLRVIRFRLKSFPR